MKGSRGSGHGFGVGSGRCVRDSRCRLPDVTLPTTFAIGDTWADFSPRNAQLQGLGNQQKWDLLWPPIGPAGSNGRMLPEFGYGSKMGLAMDPQMTGDFLYQTIPLRG